MKRPQLIFLLVPLLLGLLSLNGLRADDSTQVTTESRLRDALRSTMQQLQDAQAQIATLQATQAQSEKDNTDLKAKIDALNSQVASLAKQNADDKAVSDKSISDLKSQNTDLTTQVVKLNEALAAWEKDDKEYVQLAKAKEDARAQLELRNALLQRVIDDRETKNLALFNLGNEILTRYEKFSLGDALAAKEPFTGLSRVKLQELVQNYKDKISDQRFTPGQVPSGAGTVAPDKKPASASAVSAHKNVATQEPPTTAATR